MSDPSPAARAPAATHAGDAPALEGALRAEGFDVRVHADGRLAVLVPACAADAADPRLRARAWPLARAAGFTHAAVELLDPGAPTENRAPLPRA